MTTSKTPAETTRKRASGPARAPKPGAAGAPTRGTDPLADLPPMPKTKPRPKPAAEPAETPLDGPATVTKKELFTRVKARTQGVKGREVRQVMDALLDEMGSGLVAGETFKLPALGTLKVQRHKAIAGADVVVCKLRRKKPHAKAKDPLAKPAEES